MFAALLVTAPVTGAQAQEEEARLLFERANAHLATGMRVHGARRTHQLQEALDAYLGVLRLGARTRNVVFNLALTLQELGREAEAFNYYSQYLREFELSEADQAAGRERMEAIRARVAVATVTSTPAGAEVRVDRRDLPVRGTTPLELALAPGEHTLFFALPGFEDTRAEASFAVGQAANVNVDLVGRAVPVQFIAPSEGRLTLDGVEIDAGRATPVAPGSHVVSLVLPNAAPVERRFEVRPGADPMTIALSAAGGPAAARITLGMNVPARAFLDGLPMGEGQEINFPALAGSHLLRVEATGYNGVEHRFSLASAQNLALDVRMGRHVSTGGLNAGRWVSFSFAAAGVVAAAITTGIALGLNAEFERDVGLMSNDGSLENHLNGLADQVETAAFAADLLWTLTGLMGGVTILLFAIDPGEDAESTVQIAATPTVGGGAINVQGRL